MVNRIQYTAHVEPVSIQPEMVLPDKWWRDFSLPVWVKTAVSAAAIATTTLASPPLFPQPIILVSEWYRDLAQPYPAKVGLPVQDQLAYVAPVSEQKETVSEDKWHQPLSLPMRLVPRSPEGQFAFVYQPPAALAPPVLSQWVDVVRPVPRLTEANQQAYAAPVSEAPETTTVDRWWRDLSTPTYRVTYRAPEGLFAWGTMTPAVAAPFIPAQQADLIRLKPVVPWQQPLAEPVSEAGETTTIDRWYQNFSLPIWVPSKIAATSPTTTEPLVPLTTGVTTVYLIGAGAFSYIPLQTATIQVQAWGGGQAGNNTNGQSGAGAYWAQLNAYVMTIGVPVPFNLGAPGMTSAQAGGDTWWAAPSFITAPGGGSASAPVGNSYNAGGVLGGTGSTGNPGGGGAGGPNGVGAGGTVGSNTFYSSSGGSASNGGAVGNGATGSAGGAGGSNSFGTGGSGGILAAASGLPGGPGAGGGGGFGENTGGLVMGQGGNGGDDYDHGGGGGGGGGYNGGATAQSGGYGGTPGGGAGQGDPVRGTPWGGFSEIKLTYGSAGNATYYFYFGSIVQVDNWWHDLSIPVWSKPPSRPEGQFAFNPLPIPNTAITPVLPAQPPYLPQPQIFLAAQQQAFAEPVSEAPEIVYVSRWWRDLATPVWSKQPVAWQQTLAMPVSEANEFVSIDKWLQPIAQPYPAQRRTAEGYLAWSPPPPAPSGPPVAGDVAKQGHVVGRVGLHASRQHGFVLGDIQPVVTAFQAIVLLPWTDVIRPTPRLAEANQQAWAGPPWPYPETVSIDRWMQPLAQPYPALRSVAQQQAVAAPTWPYPETVYVSEWGQPLAQPYPAKQFVAYQQPWAGPVSEAPETTTIDRWWQDLSKPTPPRASVGVAQQQFLVVPVSEAPETVSLDRWLQQLSLPVLPRRSPEGVFAWDNFMLPASIPAPVCPPQWPDIIRPVPRVAWFQPHTAPVSEQPETVSIDRWLQPLAQPYPYKVGLYASEQAFYAAPVSEQPETTTVDRWWQPLSNPYPDKVGMRISSQMAFVTPVSEAQETVTVDRWWQPLSLFPGARAALAASSQLAGVVPFGAIQTQSLTIAAVQWHWNTQAMQANAETQMNISEVTWHWNPAALTVTTPYAATISEITWRWVANAMGNSQVVPSKGRFDTVRQDIWGVIRAVVKSVVVD